MRPRGKPGASRGVGLRHKTTTVIVSGSLAILPVLVTGDAAVRWLDAAAQQTDSTPVADGPPPGLSPVSVDGSLPDSPVPDELEVPSDPVTGALGIPSSALDAYRRAADRMAAEHPGCNIDWALLASIGRIESSHARDGYVDADGTSRAPILGPVLNGHGDVAAIRDTDGGAYDGDTTWDRAVGPMQFIPSTWQRYAADGNGDGKADPNNLYDAALAAARYLCSGGVDLSDPQQLRVAIHRYNNSWAYVDTVIRWAKAYRSGVLSVPDSTVPPVVPDALSVTAAGSVQRDPSSGAQVPSGGEKPGDLPGTGGGAPTLPKDEEPPATELPSETNPDPSEPGEEPTEPSEPGEEPTEPSEPGEEPTEPSEPGEEPTEPSEPGEEPTSPCQPEDGTDEDPEKETDTAPASETGSLSQQPDSGSDTDGAPDGGADPSEPTGDPEQPCETDEEPEDPAGNAPTSPESDPAGTPKSTAPSGGTATRESTSAK